MANEIKLGIDIDTHTVRSAEKDMAGLAGATKKVETAIGSAGKTSARTAAELEVMARAGGAFGNAINSAGRTLTKFNLLLGNTTSLGRAAQGAIFGFIGTSFIKNLIDTTQSLQRIDNTFLAVTGSASDAALQMAYVTKTAGDLGQSVLSSAGAYAQLLAAAKSGNISLQDTRNIFEGVSAAASAFNLRADQTEGALLAIQQMISKGSVQAEELRGQLGERLPGAFNIAARSMHMTTQELTKALSLGKVSAQEFVHVFGPELQKEFENFALHTKSSTRSLNELGNAMLMLKKAIITSGFDVALADILDSLTGIAKSDEAAAVARALGEAFKFAADNIEVAVLALGAIAAIFLGLPAMIAGVAVALALFTQRTFEIGGETVKVATLIETEWAGVKEVVSGTWAAIVDIISGSIQAVGDVFAQFAPVVEAVGTLFATIHDHAVANFGTFDQIFNVAVTAFNQFLGAVTDWANKVIAAFMYLWNQIKEIWGWILAKISGGLTSLGSALGQIPGAGAVAEMFNNASAAVDQFTNNAGGKITDLANTTVKAVDDATKGLQDIGAKAGDVVTATANATNGAVKTIGDAIDNTSIAVKADTAGIAAGVDAISNAVDTAAQKTHEAGVETEKLGRLTKQTAEQARANADATGVAAANVGKLGKAHKAAAEHVRALTDVEKAALKEAKDLENEWNNISDSISKAFIGLTEGKDPTKGLGNLLTGIQDMFEQQMKPMFDGLAKSITNSLRSAMSSISKSSSFLAPATVGAVGAGLGTAAVGVMNGSVKEIGGGIGAAAGAALGSFFGPIGTMLGGALGGAAGGLLSGLFGRGKDNWKRPSGVAFEGTTFASSVTGSRRVNTDHPIDSAGKFAFLGVQNLLGDFNKELREFVEAAGSTVKSGSKLVVNETKALKLITGTLSDRTANRPGESEAEAGARITKKITEIMNLAAKLAEGAGPPLTAAQQAFRAIVHDFSKANVEILHELGFSVKTINDARAKALHDLRVGFNTEVIDTLVGTNRETASELKKWRDMHLRALGEQEKAALKTAREIGGSLKLVRDSFNAQRADVRADYAGKLADRASKLADQVNGPLDAAIAKFQLHIAALTDTLNRLDQQRSDILRELTTRSQALRGAEKALRDERRSLAGDQSLSPGGPLDRLATLTKQFHDAIAAVKRGDTSRVGDATGLASSVLGAGRDVYASSTAYARLFASVNRDLLAAQGTVAGKAGKIEKTLDAETFSNVTEKSTTALLKALSAVNRSITNVEKKIDDQNKLIKHAETKKKVA
jgi:tape measure domain-containing protein